MQLIWIRRYAKQSTNWTLWWRKENGARGPYAKRPGFVGRQIPESDNWSGGLCFGLTPGTATTIFQILIITNYSFNDSVNIWEIGGLCRIKNIELISSPSRNNSSELNDLGANWYTVRSNYGLVSVVSILSIIIFN